MTIPYILAGTGNGINIFISSETKLMARIIPNCFKYFI